MIQPRMFGSLWPVSPLTLGGGGIGQVWGATTRDEAIATVRSAVDGGITLIDLAPSYGDGEAEHVVGVALEGRIPDGVRLTTKVHVGHDPTSVEGRIVESLEQSLERLWTDHVDVLLLHSQIVPEPDPGRTTWTTPLSLYQEAVRPVMHDLVERGRIGAWGITAVQFPAVLETVFTEEPLPQVAQVVANVMDAPGDMAWTPVRPRDQMARAVEHGLAVMAIRAVQAGALTDSLDRDLDPDHPVRIDFERASPFRSLAAGFGESAALLAHRYLSMDGVDTVVLGVKNRVELAECLEAAARGPLSPDEVAAVDEVMAPLR